MRIGAALTSGLLFAAGGVLWAAPVTYTVSGTFSDGATVSGTIALDNVTSTVVSFHVVTQHNAATGLGTTYDSATGTAMLEFPLSPPPVSGNYFDILLIDASGANIFGFTLAGVPSAFAGGSVIPSVPIQSPLPGGDSLLTLEENFTSGNRRGVGPSGILLTPPPTPPAPVPALGPAGILAATAILAILGCYKTSRFALRR